MIVIDVGSAEQENATSIPHLVEGYRPRLLYGFDPAGRDLVYEIGETTVVERTAAAWVEDGTVGFLVAGLGGQVSCSSSHVPCVDLAEFILALPDEGIVLKIDAEGAEYVLLPHLHGRGADLRLDLALVEWHCEACGIGGNGRHSKDCPADKVEWEHRRASVERLMRCKMGEWCR